MIYSGLCGGARMGVDYPFQSPDQLSHQSVARLRDQHGTPYPLYDGVVRSSGTETLSQPPSQIRLSLWQHERELPYRATLICGGNP